ncbi:MAG: di-trans,poly-cis-decaprenylcistransferase [Planctomycetota bacterium]|nr:MAG: di-trans,poly-cis-decaprenylcistransferase [Planctomycetota bacterium]
MSFASQSHTGLHVAVIMDGNGRWAELRRQPRSEGHAAGAAAVRRVVEAAPDLGVSTLSLYAFSSDNWKRPEAEVAALLRLLGAYLGQEAGRCRDNGVRLSVLGRRDRLPAQLADAVAAAERDTAAGARLWLRIAWDYSARDAILAAAAAAATRAQMSQALGPDVDLLIRTGGEQRLSDFLLWECAYAELLFLRTLWPDFGGADLAAAVRWFHARKRRFGGLPAAPAPPLRRAGT